MDIVVLAGGLSPERDVSLSSGSLIANALIQNGHRVLLVDLYAGLEGVCTFEEAYQKYRVEEYHYRVPDHEPDLARIKAEHGNRQELIGPGVLDVCKTADVAFLALHGSIGENGKLQAVLDVHAIRYTGSGYTGSLLAMNKLISKELMRQNGLPTPDWVTVGPGEEMEPPFLPCVIKPASNGSSIGVSIVTSKEDFGKALAYARTYEDELLIEKQIVGREFSVGILDGQALPVIEIIPREGFYDYKNKYQQGMTQEVCPAEISPELARRLQETALAVHKALRLGDYSRVDLMSDGENVYCLEANTLPGMTPTSLLPQEAAVIGISYPELCERIVQLAMKHPLG
ncbi:MAG TPA: D-alanine--D-alanine ligase [Clostridiales bacterium]|nr:D-alanine--D-alanine ligase [Clostridiales bacterium]